MQARISSSSACARLQPLFPVAHARVQAAAANATRRIHTVRPLSSRKSSNVASTSRLIPKQKRTFHSSSSTFKDPYNALGVSKDASAADIKKSYFKLAKQYHPDTNKDPASKEKFLEIQKAYEILSDDAKRSAYDTYGDASTQAGFDANAFASGNPFGAGGFHGFNDFSGGFGGGGSAGDLFSQLFGQASGARARPTRGQDIETSITITFLEGCQGSTKTVNVMPVVECDPCSGSGLKAGAKRTKCPTCKGSGTQRFVLNSGFAMESTCGTCQGAGSTVPRSSQCGSCGGLGRVKERKQVQVDIPAGIEDGMTIRVPGAGDAALSSGASSKFTSGDLLVRVNISSSKLWRRQGTNLYHDARVPLHTALLGGRVTIPTLDGETVVAVPSGTQPGQDVVLRGRGVNALRSRSKGDLYVSFMVDIPKTLTDRQRKIIQMYADDVEGRDSPSETNKPGDTVESDSADSAASEESSKPTDDGQPSGWQKLKGLFGKH